MSRTLYINDWLYGAYLDMLLRQDQETAIRCIQIYWRLEPYGA